MTLKEPKTEDGWLLDCRPNIIDDKDFSVEANMTEYRLEIYGSTDTLERLREALDDYLVEDKAGQPVLDILKEIDGYTIEAIEENE